jgi:N-acyl-D-amino-acid deacylase
VLVFRGATVYPGDGPALALDVGIEGGSIAAVGERLDGDVIDAKDLALCPGFVDLHAHSALVPFDDPLLTPKLLQGFTTEVINPDGLAPAPVHDVEARRAYLRALEGSGPAEWRWSTFAEYLDAIPPCATTLLPSAPHGSIREVAGGDRDALLRETRLALEAGAWTLSFGLVYIPGAFADTDELVAVGEIAAEFGVPLVPHVRNEGAGVLDAVGEMVEVSERSGARLHLSHLKSLSGEELVEPLLALVDEARLTFDQYPYGAGATLLASVLPAWAQEGGAAETLRRLREPAERARIAHDVAHGVPGWENLLGTLGPEHIVVDGVPLSERGSDAVDVVCALLTESELAAPMVLHYASDAAVRRIAAHPRQLVGSDGIFGSHPHPRLYGTAPRFLGRFAFHERLLPVEEAVARLTARAVDLLGLTDRGRIEVGKRADLVLLDLERYVDAATYDDPRRSPDGVRGVWVAGQQVVRDGVPTGALPGGVLRRA